MFPHSSGHMRMAREQWTAMSIAYRNHLTSLGLSFSSIKWANNIYTMNDIKYEMR